VQFVAFDDFEDPVSGASGSQRGTRSLIARIGKNAQNEREQSPCAWSEYKCGTIAILDAGRMNGSAQQQTERVYEKVAFLALDLLSRIVAMRIDVRPPFPALLTL